MESTSTEELVESGSVTESKPETKPETKTPQQTPKKESRPEPRQPEEIDPVKDFHRFLRTDEAAQKFMMMCVITGKIVNPEALEDEYEIKKFLADFEAWKKSGMPTPSMPKLPTTEIAYPTAMYRIQDRGENKFYAYMSNGVNVGLEIKPVFERAVNPLTNQEEETDVKIGTANFYTKPFDAKEVKQLIKDFNKLAPPHVKLAFYFYHGGSKKQINEDNFLKPYAEVVQMINTNQPIF